MGGWKRIDQGVFKPVIPLPSQLAETRTALNSAFNVREKTLSYQNRIPGPGLVRLRSWMKETLKPDLAKEWCREWLIAEQGWTVRYEYRNTDHQLVASTQVSRSDCRRLTSEQA